LSAAKSSRSIALLVIGGFPEQALQVPAFDSMPPTRLGSPAAAGRSRWWPGSPSRLC